MVSAELGSSSRSDDPDAAGEDELSLSFVGVPLALMSINTDAASSSWTCWCFEMRSFDVTCHCGVCSHLSSVY